ncbi:MAG: M28 family peptidase [Niabella sp.]
MNKRQTVFLVIFLGSFFIADAQKKSTPEIFAKTITAKDLKKQLTIIAGAEMEGRDTPSPGLEKAADYISGQFKKFGLKPGNKGSYRQTYSLIKDSIAAIALQIDEQSYTSFEDIAPYFVSDNNLYLDFNEFAFVGFGIKDENRDDYAGLDVKNKLVVLVNETPKNYTSSKQGRLSPAFIVNRIKLANENGAKAVLVISEKIPRRINSAPTYKPAGNNSSKGVPVFIISERVAKAFSGETFSAITNALNNGTAPLGLHDVSVKVKYNTNESRATASNIIGVVEGTDKKDEYVVISAHYDHVGKSSDGKIYYGADDDGSGTVSVLEMAEAFAAAKKAGKGPRRSIIFMTVSGEEKGLWGSEYYASNSIFPLEKTSVDLNIDMIGRIGTDYLNHKDANNYIYVVGDDKLSSDLTPITEAVNKKYTKLVLDRKFNDPDDPERIYYRSDHYNFAKNGVPAIFYFNGIHADYHQPTDTIDKINFDLLAKRAQLVFYTAWEMANRNDMLKRDLELPARGR